MSLVGYARVSTAEGRQILDPQLDARDAAGCEPVFEDHTSGAAADRPNLAAGLDYLRRGDVLVELDRLGRRASELISLIDDLDQRGVGFHAIISPMDTTMPADRAFLQIHDGAVVIHERSHALNGPGTVVMVAGLVLRDFESRDVEPLSALQ